MSKSIYISEKFNSDPVGFLANVTDLNAHLPKLRQRGDALFLLNGLVTYRSLSNDRKIAYMAYVSSLDDRSLGSKFYSLVALQVANPYWYSWSLTDIELREMHDFNADVASHLKVLGVGTAASFSLTKGANTFFDLLKTGSKESAIKLAKSMTNFELGEKTVSRFTGSASAMRMGGHVTSYLTVMGAVLYVCAQKDSERAKHELLRRGLLTTDDL
jgi:hypothetical protein